MLITEKISAFSCSCRRRGKPGGGPGQQDVYLPPLLEQSWSSSIYAECELARTLCNLLLFRSDTAKAMWRTPPHNITSDLRHWYHYCKLKRLSLLAVFIHRCELQIGQSPARPSSPRPPPLFVHYPPPAGRSCCHDAHLHLLLPVCSSPSGQK